MTGKIYQNFAYKTQKGRRRGDIPDKLIYKTPTTRKIILRMI